MNCPNCGSYSDILSEVGYVGGVHRWRMCEACGDIFATVAARPAGPTIWPHGAQDSGMMEATT